MATKSITITTEAYERLAALKGPKDSFSDVINKNIKKHSLMELYGVLSDKEGEELARNIAESRKIKRKIRRK